MIRTIKAVADVHAISRPLRVLMVADPDSADQLVSQLRAGGYEPETLRVESREDLHEALPAEGWDVVICSDGLPDFEGPEALRLAKRLRPDLPLVVVSATFGESVAAAAMKAGADDFIAAGLLARLVPAVERETRAAKMRRGWEEAAQSLVEIRVLSTAFMDNSPAAAFLKDSAGRLVYANKTFERMVGGSFESLRGKTDFERFPASVAEEIRAHDGAVFESGRVMEFEESIPTTDGPRHWLVFRFPFRDASGRRLVGGVAVDITERRRAQEELQRANEFRDSVLESTVHAMALLDREGRFTLVNERAAEITGYSRLELTGRPFAALLEPAQAAAVTQDFREAVERGAALPPRETTLIRKDGARRALSFRCAPVLIEGRVVAVVGTGEDVTDRERPESPRA